ncbi:MAG: hydrogenase nickel incorporation protein HypB [Burkholderiales bacterium]|nr:hydrogenase nickel incorporation protein HypB [Burkholderiales bacterium]
MCVVCGCGTDEAHGEVLPGKPAAVQDAKGDLHYGLGGASAHVPGLSKQRTVQIEADVLGANQRLADRNRAHFLAHGVTAYNLVSGPGSGKTTLLCATITALQTRCKDLPVAVIEGDQQTTLDADRIRATGAAAIQVNTGRGCHLDAQMVGDAFARLDLHSHAHTHAHAEGHSHADGPDALLFIENVGNLVCPALWDLGEAAKVVILSVTEGEDKPLKYPDMFAAAQLMVINKIDLLPYVSFDVARCIEAAQRINPDIEVLQLSATRGDGMDTWLDWLVHGHRH